MWFKNNIRFPVIILFQTRYVKCLVVILSVLFILTLFGPILMNSQVSPVYSELMVQNSDFHKYLYEQFFGNRRDWITSSLGSILFKNEEIRDLSSVENYTYTVLVWKHWEWLQDRHVRSYGSSRSDPLDSCSVTNCIFTGNDSQLNSVDAVIIHLQKGIIPTTENRNTSQRWIFLDDESPKHAFSLSKNNWQLEDLADIFNWSMTYRYESDIPVPYGRTLPYEEALKPKIKLSEIGVLIPNWKKKRSDVPATVLMSNCGVTSRNDFIKELKKYIKVDVYGGCADDERNKNSCPGHFKSDCEPISEYLFYLVLENSSCQQYLTEKIFYHAYSKGAIPVIMGPLLKDCELLLPPNSYLHIDEFGSIKELAENINILVSDTKKLLSMHLWRNNFRILNEHGYFGSKSYHLCRVCEALNYNDKDVKIYSEDDLREYLDPYLVCSKQKPLRLV